ncbi:MAG: hypothetical protein ACD_2C00225G0005 [uncultured bacterium (gcode 4)]|uniref:Helix-turn-helix domain-containing protein n=1 Tax=uncultured bacterium (gcode 4) TaxID=1234023 RepID=K2G484_9BACT|nr:MAG: hypothetical protein ACD_2C00225G0005 [uncultured bacterium (gcode 4)]
MKKTPLKFSSALTLRKIIKQELKKALSEVAVSPHQLLNDKEAAAFLKVAAGTLPVWRSKSKGPSFVKIGSCTRYRMSDLLDFISNNTINPR